MYSIVSRVRNIFSLLRTQVEERPVRAILLLWGISLPFAALLSLCAALYWRAGHISYVIAEADYSLTQRVQRVAEMTELKFEVTRKLTALLTTDSRIIAALKGEGNFEDCTRYLQNVSETLRLHRAFLLDKNGLCVASNDAGMPKNLLGVNLADRDYFIRAMDGESTVQFVVGRISTIPGFHFSASVGDPDGYLGVVVLKLDTATLAQQLYLPAGFVTDSAGVIVLSDQPENVLRVVPDGEAASLEPEQIMLRYQRDSLAPVYLRKVSVDGHEAWLLHPDGQPFLRKVVESGTEGRKVYGFKALGPMLEETSNTFYMRLVVAFLFFTLASAILISTGVNLLRDRYLRRTLQELNNTLRFQAQYDFLTGLLNRRMFDEMAEAWFSQTQRLKAPFSLVLFDIDRFKRLNDEFGHQAGDQVLRQIALCIQGSLLRKGDRVFRIGGEEFAVLASADNDRQIFSLMERLRKAVEDLGLQHPDGPDKVVTISLGGILVSGRCTLPFDAAFKKADDALYRAKAEGRNRSVLTSVCTEDCTVAC